MHHPLSLLPDFSSALPLNWKISEESREKEAAKEFSRTVCHSDCRPDGTQLPANFDFQFSYFLDF